MLRLSCYLLLSFLAGGTVCAQHIVTAPYAPHIARISGDTLVLVNGRTQLYTTDTEKGAGVISTGIDLSQLPAELIPVGPQRYTIVGKDGTERAGGRVYDGDQLLVAATDGHISGRYILITEQKALGGRLELERPYITVGTGQSLTLYFTAGQRSPDVTVKIMIPAGIVVQEPDITVNVIGRGDVKLKGLATQSVGRVASLYPWRQVGAGTVEKQPDGTTVLIFRHLDLRPANGADLKVVLNNVAVGRAGDYVFKAIYTTSKPEMLTSAGTGAETATLTGIRSLTDFRREPDRSLRYNADGYTTARFLWTSPGGPFSVIVMQSVDKGRTWSQAQATVKNGEAVVSGLQREQLYAFRLQVKNGPFQGTSNTAWHYTGRMDIRRFGATGADNEDNTLQVNDAIDSLHRLGGGTLLFSKGTYSVRTVHLKSNVYLYVEKGAVIRALKGADAPETTWFCDRDYRSGLSPTDTGPYEDPENYLTKQDVGHHYFRNAMFFGERLDNVKIIGNGYITGNGNLSTSDKVMNNAPDKRADKMFVFKLCTNVEIGGLYRKEDLWYDEANDRPYYIGNGHTKIADTDNMLHIDRAGHFVLLATGTDSLYVHDTWFGKENPSGARDIYDFMGCSHVWATNIYSRVSSDDIIKPGSDCSLGFTRPATDYKVRNIIGDTNCNLFQVGSETADDITNICVDNIYVLGANKAGFSISTNDGAHVKDIHLNCGHTGPLHSRSKMLRAATPFFISISNRGRILGAEAGGYTFRENGKERNELLVKNVNIGVVENILLNGIDISEVYGGSSFNGERWKAYDGSQKRITSVVAGYKLPDDTAVAGGLHFKLPDGRHTGYIRQVVFRDVHVTDKGGNVVEDRQQYPPELGVGQYNAVNLKVQPSYGLWARHVEALTIENCSFNYEQRDSRFAVFTDDVTDLLVSGLRAVQARDAGSILGFRNTTGVKISNAVYYQDVWGSPEKSVEQGSDK